MNLIRKIVLVCLLAYLPAESMAWSMLGHRIVGQIADSYLSNRTRKNIGRILGNESVAMASNWADFIKSDSTYKYLDNWHFINFDKPLTFSQMQEFLQNDQAVDAYTKLNFMIGELKKPGLPMEQKAMYLRLVIHIVGDIHQPLHTGHLSDRGGNDIKVSWFNEPTNLHSVWDSKLVDYQQLSYTEYAAAINFTTRLQREQMTGGGLPQWLYESHQAVQGIYAGVKPNDRLGYRYNFDHVALVNQQLLKGGVRLASVLNDIFGK